MCIGSLKPNAFLEPNNPTAIFPQRKKENNIDFRSTAIVNSGMTVRFTSRKNVPGSTKEHSKYQAFVKTREELDAEEAMAAINAQQEEKKRVDADLTESHKILEKMAISEKPKVKEVDMELDSKQKKMLAKIDGSAVGKKKKSKRGSRRTLVY